MPRSRPISVLGWVLVCARLIALIGCAAGLGDAPGTPRPLRVNPATPTVAVSGLDARSAWLFGTPTGTATLSASVTPGPSPTATVTPTPLNAETLKGKLLFASSRPLPPAYTAPGAAAGRLLNPDLLQSWGARGGITVWQWDPATFRLTPCDPAPATPTPYPPGSPTPALLFGGLSQLGAGGASVCQTVYAAGQTAQTFSADQRFQVYVGSDPNGGRPQIFVLDHQTNTRQMVTKFGRGVSYDPVFAPDGYRLAFISQAEGPDNLYTVTRDGTELKRLTRLPDQGWTTTWEWLKRPTWSADGTQLAFWSNRVSGARQIWVAQADGAQLFSVSNDPRPSEDWDPVWIR